MTTLPRERELPPAVRARIRAELVATAAPVRPARPRRWLPAAAAAGLAAVVLAVTSLLPGSAPGPAVGGGNRPGPRQTFPTPPPGPTDRAALTRRCIADTRAVAGAGAPVTGGGLRVLFEDGYGYVVQVAGPTYTAMCTFDRDGRDIATGNATAPSPGASGYLPDGSREAVRTQEWGNGSTRTISVFYPDTIPGPGGNGRMPSPGSTRQRIGNGRDTRYAAGVVRRDVARIRVTWAGATPVWAAIEGPFWLARAVLPPGEHETETPADIVAYDRDGHVVGRDRILG